MGVPLRVRTGSRFLNPGKGPDQPARVLRAEMLVRPRYD